MSVITHLLGLATFPFLLQLCDINVSQGSTMSVQNAGSSLSIPEEDGKTFLHTGYERNLARKPVRLPLKSLHLKRQKMQAVIVNPVG